jgi:holliday junction DNA helicase RuvA
MAVRNFKLLSGFHAQNARQMMGIVAGELSCAIYNFGDKESPSRHRLSFLLMIALLRGTLLEKHPNQAIVDAGGVGYDLTIPVSTFTGLPDVGAEVKLRVHTHVREDILALYGFLTQDEKTLFEKLIGVSGIGPKLAITVLSGLAAGQLIHAIRTGAIELLVKVPGIGKKTAERMVLELRDKLLPVQAAREDSAGPAFNNIEEDVLSALMNLGCARPAAEAAVRKAKAAGTTPQFEPMFRRSLELVR